MCSIYGLQSITSLCKKEAYWRALSFWQHKMVLPRFHSSPTNGCDFGINKEKKKKKNTSTGIWGEVSYDGI
jgi:hypothetical protein